MYLVVIPEKCWYANISSLETERVFIIKCCSWKNIAFPLSSKDQINGKDGGSEGSHFMPPILNEPVPSGLKSMISSLSQPAIFGSSTSIYPSSLESKPAFSYFQAAFVSSCDFDCLEPFLPQDKPKRNRGIKRKGSFNRIVLILSV